MNKNLNIKNLIIDKPLKLDCGQTINNFPLAYETYGSLNEKKDNAILVFHALTGDQFVSGINPITKKDGWWSYAVGPNKAIDTKKYFVICANVIGGCMGSYGPSNIDLNTKKILGTNFPVITINDMVNAQYHLLDFFKINKLFAVMGGSMGGMQTLQFVNNFPNKAKVAIPIACTASHSAQNIAFNELGRQSIMADANWENGDYSNQNKNPNKAKIAIPIATTSNHSAQNIAFNELGRQSIMADTNWMGGDYSNQNKNPDKGLSVARMAAHITYLSKNGLQEKFGRKLQERDNLKFSFDADFQIESYLRYQGSVFVDRFDANSYLYITRAMDYFDLVKQHGGNLSKAFTDTKTKFLVISFTSDWLYPTSENKEIVIALNAIGADVGFVEIESDKGHDSFLLNTPNFLDTLKDYINTSYLKNK